MKKTIIGIVILTFTLPQISFAAWWNISTWFNQSNQAVPIQKALDTNNSPTVEPTPTQTQVIEKEVIKEVPIEKVIEKKVEVPVYRDKIVEKIKDNPELVKEKELLVAQVAEYRRMIDDRDKDIKSLKIKIEDFETKIMTQRKEINDLVKKNDEIFRQSEERSCSIINTPINSEVQQAIDKISNGDYWDKSPYKNAREYCSSPYRNPMTSIDQACKILGY